MRNTKEETFHEIAKAVAKRSACLSRQIGAVLVFEDTVVATGYNGPPRGMRHCGEGRPDISEMFKGRLSLCPRKSLEIPSGKGLEYCYAAHAERNCLLNAARTGIATIHTDLYMTGPVPFKDCLIELIQAGVRSVTCERLTLYQRESLHLIKQGLIFIQDYNENYFVNDGTISTRGSINESPVS
jgi:dCMP deaminase